MTKPTEKTPEKEIPTRQLDLPKGTPQLRSIYLYATTGCNLQCRHCWITPTFVNGEPSKGDCIDLELFKQTVKQAKTLGLNSVKMTGGEPMIHPQFREIASFIKEEKLRSDMETNGTCIDPDTARFIKEETSISFISVSIDSTNPTKHDKFRGLKGAFERTIAGTKNLVEVGFKPQVIMCPHRGNIHEIDAMVELATSLGAGSVKFNPVTNAGRGTEMHKKGQSLDYDETIKLIRYVNGELQKKSEISVLLGAPMAMLTIKDMLNHRWSGLCNVRHILGILGTGHMALCGIGRNIPELCYGELGKDNLRETWINNPLLAEIREKLDGDYPGICGNCVHVYRCRTGCLAMNYMNGGKLFSPSPLCAEAERRGEFPTTRKRDA